VIDVRGDIATGISNLSCQCAQHDDGAMFVAATYNDEFARRGGVWKFTRRAIDVHFFAAPSGIKFPEYKKE
jgi:hypothetical protein